MSDRRVRNTVVVTALMVVGVVATAVFHDPDEAPPTPRAGRAATDAADDDGAPRGRACGGRGAPPPYNLHVPPAPYSLRASSARLRAAPSLRGRILGLLLPHEAFDVRGEHDGWIQLTDRASGTTGWVDGRLIGRDPGEGRTC
ncbi:SH3 domain-containing protein [Streptomyces sp. NPDC051940]|uniref:SH3 domain-containing protein n=1 Tax=Streptomyces sp. NPDC051940 TaxID=3155675 RepID=UPI00342C9061